MFIIVMGDSGESQSQIVAQIVNKQGDIKSFTIPIDQTVVSSGETNAEKSHLKSLSSAISVIQKQINEHLTELVEEDKRKAIENVKQDKSNSEEKIEEQIEESEEDGNGVDDDATAVKEPKTKKLKN